jgi:hypothetical protein
VEKLARDHSRQRAKLVTAAERRAARKHSEEARTEWQKTSLLGRLDADQRAAAKSKARRQLERRLGRTIRRYRELGNSERSYLRETGRAARDLFKRAPRAGAHINWGPIVWAEPFVEATSFTAPFPHHVLESGDLHGPARGRQFFRAAGCRPADSEFHLRSQRIVVAFDE